MSELKYTATQMNNVMSSSQKYYRSWREVEKINKELRARISELSQAVGLITTLKPTMVMDVDHPLDMAKEVEAYVTARIAGLEAANDALLKDNDMLFRASVAGKSPNDTQSSTIVYGKESEE